MNNRRTTIGCWGLHPFESNPRRDFAGGRTTDGSDPGGQSGQPADLAQRILNEIAGAKLSLLDPDIKRAYDADLAKRTPPPLPPQIAETACELPHSQDAAEVRTSWHWSWRGLH